MTLTEAEKKIDELYRKHGKDYVIHADNHPDILRALNDDIIARMEAESAEMLAELPKGRKLEELTMEEVCEIAVQAGRRAGRREIEAAKQKTRDA